MASARGAWKRIREGEIDVAVRRKTRAGIKYVHKLKGATEADIERYKERNKAALGDKFAAAADFFMNDEGGIDVVQGDGNLSEIEDIRHHIHTWFLASPVPMSVLGYGQDINYSVVEHQKQQYDETLEEVRKWVAEQFVKPLLELAWLLAGILPETLDFEIKWPTKKVLAVADLKAIADSMLALQAAGVPQATVAKLVARFLPGIEPEEILELTEPGEPADPAMEARRLARISGIFQQAAAVTG